MGISIDLTKSFLYNACKLYSISNFQAKPYYDKIELGLKWLDLLHYDITSLFIEELYGVTNFVTFLYNTTKRFEIVLLTKKIKILPTFKKYCLHHKMRNKQVRHLYTDREKKYDFY